MSENTNIFSYSTLKFVSKADYNQPSTADSTGWTAVSSPVELAKLGKKGLAEGLRPDPRNACEAADWLEGLVTGDAC